MNKTVSVIITAAIVVLIGSIFRSESKSNTNPTTGEAMRNNEVKDDIQYITIHAKGGYSPKVSTAKAGMPTKLIVKTNGTYDCSASFVIRSLGFQKTLARTGEEVIDIGTPKVGQSLQGLCSMGMYSFLIQFK
jgi:plastocyanin domain-containing protein